MIERKANTYRLYPSANQARQMMQIAGAVRYTYNLALQQRSEFGRKGRAITFASQCREVTMLRAEVEWLRDVPVIALQQALKDVERAYQNWWSGRAGHPRARKKGSAKDAFRFSDVRDINIRRTGRSSAQIRLPKIGWVRLRGWYLVPGTMISVTVAHRAGKWFISVHWQREIEAPSKSDRSSVGIDQGVAVFAALSDGTKVASAHCGRKAIRRLSKAQRDLARKKKGSNNRKKAVKRVARLHLRVANARKDFLHKQSTIIAKNHSTVVLEKLQIKNMTRSAKGTKEKPGKNIRQKAGLNRSILDQGWGMFRTMLAYKLADRGGQLIEVPAAYTSQTCADCGHVDTASRESQSKFACTSCGHAANADTNAAINMLRRADSALRLVEASHQRACEAGTILELAARAALQEAIPVTDERMSAPRTPATKANP